MDAVVFDMDGTLLDSSSACPDAYIETSRSLGGPDVDRAGVIALYPFGPPIRLLSELLGRTVTAEDVGVYHHNLAVQAVQVRPYPGIVELLDALRVAEVRLAVFTGADQHSAELLLDAVGLLGRFDVVLGSDDVAVKPSGEGLAVTAGALGVAPQRLAYVGDGPLDQLAAREVGAVAIAAGWGHLCDRAPDADAFARTPREVLELVVAARDRSNA